MALTATVTKTNVRLAMPKMWAITLTLVVTDDDGPGFTRSFSQNYKTGTKVLRTITGLGLKFKAEMQAAIDQYRAERVVFDHAHLTTLVSEVELGLEV